MKSRYSILLGAFGLVCMASLAHAEEGWYASGQVRGSLLSSADVADPTDIVFAFATKSGLDLGHNLSGAVGYNWGNLRVEGEIAYTENGFDSLEVLGALGAGAKGDMSSLGFMVNAFRDFEISGPWRAYFGGGVGPAIVSINNGNLLGIPLVDNDDTVFAYQVGTGMRYRMSSSTALALDYRFFSTLDPGFEDVVGVPFESGYVSHSLRASVRVTF